MTETPKKPSSLKQRLITAFALVAALLTMLAIGGWVAVAVTTFCIAIGVYEELNTLRQGGYRPVWWTAFASLGLGAVLVMLHSPTIIVLLMAVLILCVQLCIMRREDPQLPDIMVSVLPMLTIVLPGLCLISLLVVQPRALQLMLLLFVFASAIGCDTLAYFVGSTVGGPKLCPHISPKKTISGAIGGMVGSVLFMLIVEGCFRIFTPELFSGMPVYWTILVALICGAAAQLGDLFASMVKRHCKVKDFGTIFPGHGGMMDRIDSILFTSVVIFCYRAILLGLI